MRSFRKGVLCTPSYWEHLTRNRIPRWFVHLLKALRGNINLTSVDLSYNLDVTRKEIFYLCMCVCVSACTHENSISYMLVFYCGNVTKHFELIFPEKLDSLKNREAGRREKKKPQSYILELFCVFRTMSN